MMTKKICIQCGTEYGPEEKFCPVDGGSLRVESTDDPLIGTVVADRYHVTGLIGAGGMGRVYVAEHVRMGRKSALKVMSPALATTADAITRFNREASNASRINHPNVAAIYDFGETADGLLYIAMEFVEGETLHALIQRTGPLSIERAAQIAKGAADALFAAHHLGIIHRDLKPDNIMLARQLDGSDWVKVVDFGIAKSVAAGGQGGSGGQTVTTAGVSLGTPEYMSPEQLAGEQLDHHTDIYSLGLVLFNMLTGDLPYPKLTSKETLVRRLTAAPSTLAEVRPDIRWPEPLQRVLTRALDPEPDGRYQSVADFRRAVVAAAAAAAGPAAADDLDRTVRVSAVERQAPALAATSAQPAVAATARASAPARGAPPAKRSRRRAAFAAAGLLLLVAGAAYAVVRARGTAPPIAPTVAVTDSARDSTAADTTHQASATAAAIPVTPAKDTTAPAVDTGPKPIVPATGLGTADRIRSRHPWLRPNGDSSAADTSRTQSVQSALGEIRGHLQRAGRFIAIGRPGESAAELREAQGEMKTVRDLMPGDEMPPSVDQELLAMRNLPMRACVATAATDAQAMQRCRDYERRAGRVGGRGRGGRIP